LSLSVTKEFSEIPGGGSNPRKTVNSKKLGGIIIGGENVSGYLTSSLESPLSISFHSTTLIYTQFILRVVRFSEYGTESRKERKRDRKKEIFLFSRNSNSHTYTPNDTHNLLLVTVRPIVPLPSPNFSRRKTVSLDRDHTNKMSPASNISPAAISQFELQHYEKRKQETTNNERKEKRNATSILHSRGAKKALC